MKTITLTANNKTYTIPHDNIAFLEYLEDDEQITVYFRESVSASSVTFNGVTVELYVHIVNNVLTEND